MSSLFASTRLPIPYPPTFFEQKNQLLFLLLTSRGYYIYCLCVIFLKKAIFLHALLTLTTPIGSEVGRVFEWWVEGLLFNPLWVQVLWFTYPYLKAGWASITVFRDRDNDTDELRKSWSRSRSRYQKNIVIAIPIPIKITNHENFFMLTKIDKLNFFPISFRSHFALRKNICNIPRRN